MLTKLFTAGLVLMVIAVRTMAYAAYQKGQDNNTGAIGLYVLAVAAFVLPLVVIWFKQ